MINLFKSHFIRYSFYIVLLSLVSNSCNDKKSGKDIPIITKSMKGYELYSWQNGSNWFFSLVVGTNRNKSASEIMSNKKIVEGVENLYPLLGSMEKEDEVFWEHNEHLKRDMNDSVFKLFKFPSDSVYKKVEGIFSSRGIILHKVNRKY